MFEHRLPGRRYYAQMERSARCAFCAIFHIAIGIYVCYNTIVPKGNQSRGMGSNRNQVDKGKQKFPKFPLDKLPKV